MVGFNLSPLNVVGGCALRQQKSQKYQQSVTDELVAQLEACRHAADFVKSMAEKTPPGLDAQLVTDYTGTMRVLQTGMQGMLSHVDRMWAIDPSLHMWRAEVRIIGDTIVGMHLMAVSACGELGALIGSTSPRLKKLLAAVHSMDRFQALVRKHGPCALHDIGRRERKAAEAAALQAELDEQMKREKLEAQEQVEKNKVDDASKKAEARQRKKAAKKQRLQDEKKRKQEEAQRRRQEEERKRQEEEERQQREIEELRQQAAQMRRGDDWAALAIPDWAFGAHEQVAEIAAELEANSPGIAELRRAYKMSLNALDGDDWERFLAAHTTRVHGDDKAVLDASSASLAARADRSWVSFLKRPKQQSKIIHQVLFLGDPPSRQLCQTFQSNGWSGLFAGRSVMPITTDKWCEVTNVSAMPENAGRPLTATWIEEFRTRHRFQFVYINCTFQGNEQDLGKERTLPLLNKLPPIRAMHYGIRLREFREHLYTALQRLEDGGTLCIAWCGPPYHPALFFVVSHLRLSFQHVHVFAPADAASFEVYVLATMFRRTGKGETGYDIAPFAIFQHFLSTSQRSSGCDDVLCWCLTSGSLIDEYKTGLADYETVFRDFARKVNAVSVGLGSASNGAQKPNGPTYEQVARAHRKRLDTQGTKLPKIPSAPLLQHRSKIDAVV